MKSQNQMGWGLACLAVFGLTAMGVSAQEKPETFAKDRAAILAMAGKFEVTFRFHEIYSLNKDYTIKDKKYKETAHELVKVVEDSGKRIVLQHLLLVDDGLEVMVVKHWGQVWKYEDAEILEYQQGTSWKKKSLPAAAVKGTWTQYVTQVDDSPRYEGIGRWDHSGGSSSWTSSVNPRPLPRREYSKRKDYDVLMAVNTHVITPQGWVHEQANRKMVKRDGKQYYLCAERGFNTYKRVDGEGADFTEVEKYWTETEESWKLVRAYWSGKIDSSESVAYTRKIEGVSMGKALRKLLSGEEGKSAAKPTADAIDKVLAPYVKAN